MDRKSLDFVAVRVQIVPIGQTLGTKFFASDPHEKAIGLVDGKVFGTIDQLSGKFADRPLDQEVARMDFRAVGDGTMDATWGNMDKLCEIFDVDDIFEEDAPNLLEIARARIEEGEPFDDYINEVTFVTVWEYYASTHYSEDGNDVDEEWHFKGVVNMDRATEIVGSRYRDCRLAPTVVCLCGSTRYVGSFQRANLDETLAGCIVLTIGCDLRRDAGLFADRTPEALDKIKRDLDELHLHKIDLADEVLILNVGDSLGDSTFREYIYARTHSKKVRWLVKPTEAPDYADERERAYEDGWGEEFDAWNRG